MTIIKIEKNANGSHDNQTINDAVPKAFPVPEGYAVIPEELGTPETLENFPFGEITTKLVNLETILSTTGETIGFQPNVEYVTSWTPLPMPEPVPEPEPEPSQLDRVEAQATYTAMMTDTLLEV